MSAVVPRSPNIASCEVKENLRQTSKLIGYPQKYPFSGHVEFVGTSAYRGIFADDHFQVAEKSKRVGCKAHEGEATAATSRL